MAAQLGAAERLGVEKRRCELERTQR